MTTPPGPAAERARTPLRVIGWALLLGGIGVLAWLAWMVLATDAGTRAAQQDLLERWVRRTEAEAPVILGAPLSASAASQPQGGPVASMSFHRDGAAILRDQPLVVVAGVTDADLARGPGHYPGTALPGQPGNMAVAGHRSTHDAPFADIDALAVGDEIRLEDAAGATWVYRVVEQRIVEPGDTRVIASDPRGTGRPTLTLTTCHPRYSNRQRLVVFAELAT